MKLEQKIKINASIDKTYRIAETYPLFVNAFHKKKILWNTESSSKIQVTNIFFFMPLTWEGEGIKKKNEQIDWVQTSGLLKGLRASWQFNSLNNGQTEVVIKCEFLRNGLYGTILNSLAPVLVEKAANSILRALKSTSESKG